MLCENMVLRRELHTRREHLSSSPDGFCLVRVVILFSFLCYVVFWCLVCVSPMSNVASLFILDCRFGFDLKFIYMIIEYHNTMENE